jgi:hypothetical protein
MTPTRSEILLCPLDGRVGRDGHRGPDGELERPAGAGVRHDAEPGLQRDGLRRSADADTEAAPGPDSRAHEEVPAPLGMARTASSSRSSPAVVAGVPMFGPVV